MPSSQHCAPLRCSWHLFPASTDPTQHCHKLSGHSPPLRSGLKKINIWLKTLMPCRSGMPSSQHCSLLGCSWHFFPASIDPSQHCHKLSGHSPPLRSGLQLNPHLAQNAHDMQVRHAQLTTLWPFEMQLALISSKHRPLSARPKGLKPIPTDLSGQACC